MNGSMGGDMVGGIQRGGRGVGRWERETLHFKPDRASKRPIDHVSVMRVLAPPLAADCGTP